jgi:hypothetical protein
MKEENDIHIKKGSLASKESIKNFKEKIQARIQEIKSQERIVRKQNQARSQENKESDKNIRTQESCLTRHFLPHQTRFCLQECHKKVQIWFFRQESCIEGMAKESCLTNKKIKNLERR